MDIQLPDYIRSIRPYVPGKPIEETKREYGLKKVIKLASNENPLGSSPRALEAIRKNLKELNRYPDSSAFQLKHALAKVLQVGADRITIGNGSNELVDLVISTYCIPGDAIVTSQAAFVAYKVCAQVHGVRTLETPLTPDLRFDLQAIAERVRADSRVKLVFISNPNNPTGTYVTDSELRPFLREVAGVRDGSVFVVLDYAYWEYVNASDLSDPAAILREFPNTIVLRTFSKIYGLAGTRVGYWVAPSGLTAAVEKVREPFNVNSLGLAGAVAALGDKAFVRKAIQTNVLGMKAWEKGLNALGIPFWKSQGNFLLVDVQRGLGLTGGEVFERCLALGVIFRPVANYGLTQALRISVGLPEENRIGLKALAQLKQAGQKKESKK